MIADFNDNDPWNLGLATWSDHPCGWIGKVGNKTRVRKLMAPATICHKTPALQTQKRKTKRSGSHHNRTSKGGVPQPNPFIEHLQAVPVSRVVRSKPKQKVFKTTDTIGEALRLLNNAKSHYAPVVQVDEDDKVSFFGFVCAFDLVGFLIDRFASIPSWDRQTLKLCGDKYLKFPVAHIINYSKMNRVNDGPLVLRDSPLFQTISIFQKRVLRVPVCNKEGVMEYALDRLDIVKYLVGLMIRGRYRSFFSKTLLELELGRERVIKINGKEPVRRAFTTIHKDGVDNVAIVDDDGVLLGSFDAGQIRGSLIQRNPFAALRLPISTYLKYNGLSCPTLTCNIQTPISYVLLKFLSVKNGLSGMYFVDSDNKPKGVITLTSLMRALVTHKQPDRRQL